MLNVTEKKQYLEYINNMVKALGTLIEELRRIGSFPIDMCLNKRKELSNNVVCDCLYFKNAIEPPEGFVKIQKQINQACDIYLDFYGQLPERVEDEDIDWVRRFYTKLVWAHKITSKAYKALTKMQKRKRFCQIDDLMNT